MKFNFKSVLSLLMVIFMLLTIAACGDKENTAESEKSAGDEDFFTASLVSGEDSGETTSTENGSQAQNNNGGQTTSASSNVGGTASTTKTEVPKENKVGGKTWAEVLKSMPKNLRNTSLTVYNWNAANEYTGAPEVIKQFTKQTGIKVEWRVVAYSDYFTKLAALIASGENIPDVARTLGPVPSQMLNYQPISSTGYDFKDDAWDKNVMDMYTVNGKVYATSLQNTHIGSVSLMFYNKSLIDKYNFEDPYKLWKAGKWNWEKFIEMSKEYKELTDNVAVTGERWSEPFVTVRGLQGAIGFDGKKFYNATKSKEYLKLYQELGDYYNKDHLFARGNLEAFDEGNALFSAGGAVHARKRNSRYGNLKNSNQLYAVPIPQPKSQSKYYQGAEEAEAYAVVKGAKNAEAVPYFLRYFLDGANYELNTYFCNKQNLEVYNWCMSQKNRVFYYTVAEYSRGSQSNGLEYKVGAQVKMYIDANSGVIDRTVADYNNTLNKLK